MHTDLDRRAVLAAAAAVPIVALPAAAPAADRGAWDAALANCLALKARADSDPAADTAFEVYCSAFDDLMTLPAPDLRRLKRKLELAQERCEGHELWEDYWTSIFEDFDRLIVGGIA